MKSHKRTVTVIKWAEVKEIVKSIIIREHGNDAVYTTTICY